MAQTQTRFVSERELAEILGISEGTLRGWRMRGKGPRFCKLSSKLGTRGGMIRYLREDLERWIASCPTGGEQPAQAEAARQ